MTLIDSEAVHGGLSLSPKDQYVILLNPTIVPARDVEMSIDHVIDISPFEFVPAL